MPEASRYYDMLLYDVGTYDGDEPPEGLGLDAGSSDVPKVGDYAHLAAMPMPAQVQTTGRVAPRPRKR